jgi:hypothetical protein
MTESYKEEGFDHGSAEEPTFAGGFCGHRLHNRHVGRSGNRRGRLRRQGGGVTNAAQTQSDGWLWPGPNAGAGGRELRPGENALVLFLDPVSLVVAMPPLPSGEAALGRYCRLLARAARQLAAASHHDPGQAITTSGES